MSHDLRRVDVVSVINPPHGSPLVDRVPWGASAPDRPLYGLDIETDTSVDGLDPAVSQVVAGAVTTATTDHVFLGDEVTILSQVDELLSELEPGFLVTWNGSGFDLPFLHERARITDVTMGLHLWRDRLRSVEDHAFRGRWHDHDHLDGYRIYRADVGRSLGLPCGLKPMARLVGLTPLEVDRNRMHLLDADTLRSYVASDARLARELVRRRGPAATRSADGCHHLTTG